mmetsp:Transcript_73287/g.189063  ORF Transcript_73287/g.189063 Transcript_73287/m.189063 type:complete len:208 (-) Transcript_73287:724-1347(-)
MMTAIGGSFLPKSPASAFVYLAKSSVADSLLNSFAWTLTNLIFCVRPDCLLSFTSMTKVFFAVVSSEALSLSLSSPVSPIFLYTSSAVVPSGEGVSCSTSMLEETMNPTLLFWSSGRTCLKPLLGSSQSSAKFFGVSFSGNSCTAHTTSWPPRTALTNSLSKSCTFFRVFSGFKYDPLQMSSYASLLFSAARLQAMSQSASSRCFWY